MFFILLTLALNVPHQSPYQITQPVVVDRWAFDLEEQELQAQHDERIKR